MIKEGKQRGEKKKTVTIRLSEEIVNWIKEEAKKTSRTFSGFIEWVAREKRKKGD
jgi:predicted DNA binding CopG/RHH family protein